MHGFHEFGIFAAIRVKDCPRRERGVIFEQVLVFEVARGERVIFLEGEVPEI